MIESAEALSEQVGRQAACQALGLPRSSFYRAQAPEADQQAQRQQARPKPDRALSDQEREHVRQVPGQRALSR
jgi:hypothetical protein